MGLMLVWAMSACSPAPPTNNPADLVLREALYSYTMGNAYSAFEEQHKGAITPGKLADLVVLDSNILAIAPQQIAQTRVELTVLGGQIVWRESDANADSAADI